MVLWEITVTTAYFLGLRRTYRLALRIQRRLVGPSHPKIRQFLHRRTRSVFNMAVKVHKNIQKRDLEMGRSLGNWILRWLHRMKPSAEIRPPKSLPDTRNNVMKNATSSTQPPRTIQRPSERIKEQESNGRVNFTPLNITQIASVGMISPPWRPASMSSQYRRLSYHIPSSAMEFRRSLAEGVFRKDIAQWMMLTYR